MNKYLVTGATGLLGNNIVRQLLGRGVAVRILSRSSSDPRPMAGLDVERALGDIQDTQAVEAACRGIDVVIHSAGHVHVGWSQLDQHRRVNVEGTRVVAASARQAAAKLVHVSSINALGLGKLASPADEDSALPGIVECPYVMTKREGEQVVLDEVNRGLWAVIVNPSLMLGPWDWKPSSGKMLLASGYSPVAPSGAANFCDVRDVVEGILTAAARGTPGRRYILGGHNLTYWNAWRQMARAGGKNGPRLFTGPLVSAVAAPVLRAVAWFSGREGDANLAALAMGRQEHCFSSRRAETELGYRVRPWEQTLKDTWTWFREHGYA